MDAAGSERAAVLGFSEGAPMAALFAATYPERVTALVLYGGYAKATRTDDYPWAPATPETGRWSAAVRAWGTGENLRLFAPSVQDDARFVRWWGRFERAAASPGSVLAVLRLNAEIDIRGVLGAIAVPTLVLHRVGDVTVEVGNARALAAGIPGAKLVELPGVDHVPMVGDQDAVLDEIEEFLTGARRSAPADRVLATVLFTDLVGSTSLAARLGDRRWSDVLAHHYAAVRQELDRHAGREVKTVGDGVLATFDGPARAIRCAVAIREAARAAGVELRAGLHTGECEILGDDVGGIAVHIAARVVERAQPGEVLVSSTVRELVVGSGIAFEDRGEATFKGVPGTWRLFAVAEQVAVRAAAHAAPMVVPGGSA